MSQLRLFVALELPRPVRETLAAWAAEVGETAGSGLRLVGSDSLHVTLCFLGSVACGQVDEIVRACELARGMAVGELVSSGAVWLPRRRPRVLAVKLDDAQGDLAGVQAELSRALALIGAFKPEARAFMPHVTAARVRRGEHLRSTPLPGPPAIRFFAEQVVLYRSHLGGGPARYEALHRLPLSQR